MGEDGARAARRFARGCRCFAIEQGHRIVAFGWLSTGREWIGELSVWITPSPGEGYVWNCFTLEEHRRRGHYRSLLDGFVSLPGLKRLWIGSIEDPAEKADADAGFRPVVQFASTRIGPLRRLRADAAPGADQQLVAEALERLELDRRSVLGLARSRVH